MLNYTFIQRNGPLEPEEYSKVTSYYYLLYVNGGPKFIEHATRQDAEQLVINCGLAHRRFELSELPIPPAAILFS